MVPKFGKGASSTAEARKAASITQSVEEPTVMPNTHTVEPVEDKVDKVEEPKVEEIIKMPKILSPPTEAKLPKVQKASTATPNRRRMANMLDVVLETTKALSPAPTKKIAEAAKMQAKAETGQAEAKCNIPKKMLPKVYLRLARPYAPSALRSALQRFVQSEQFVLLRLLKSTLR